VQDIRHTKGEEEVLLAWRPTWVKASEVPDLASVPWDCTRPAHYTAGAAQQGGASGSRQTARKTARGADSMDEPPAKRGPGRPPKVPKPKLVPKPKVVPKPAAPKLVTQELLNAKRGPGRPPKWLTIAQRAAKANTRGPDQPKPVAKLVATPKLMATPKLLAKLLAKRGPGRPPKAQAQVKRKSNKLVALSSTETAMAMLAKRGPGRPPKWLTEARRAAEEAGAVQVQPVKRKPGRPPKATAAQVLARLA